MEKEKFVRKVTPDHCRRLFGRHPGLRAEYTQHGKPIWVYRAKGVYHQMRNAPGTVAFWQEYADASKGIRLVDAAVASLLPQLRANDTASVKWLVEKYLGWLAGGNAAKATKKQHRTVLARFAAQNGALPYAKIEWRHIKDMRDHIAQFGSDPDKPDPAPAMATRVVSTVRTMFDWAIREEKLIERNPCAEVTKVEYEHKTHHVWTPAEIATFLRAYALGTREHLAFALLLHTGQRCSDVVRMGHHLISDGVLTMTQQKTGKEVNVPIRPELTEALAKAAAIFGQETFIGSTGNEKGKALGAASFSQWFSRVCTEAGVPVCTAHGLRHVAATRDAEDGMDQRFMEGKYGFTAATAERYIRTADRKRAVIDGEKRRRASLRLAA